LCHHGGFGWAGSAASLQSAEDDSLALGFAVFLCREDAAHVCGVGTALVLPESAVQKDTSEGLCQKVLSSAAGLLSGLLSCDQTREASCAGRESRLMSGCGGGLG